MTEHNIPPRKRRRRWPWVILGGVVLIIIIAVSSGGGGSAPAPAAGPGAGPATSASAAADDDQVTYEVTGTGGVNKANNITYTGGNGSMSQANGKALPWQTTLPEQGAFSFYSLTAQSGSGSGNGSITCTIRKGGEVVQTNTSEGPYAVVSCTGS